MSNECSEIQGILIKDAKARKDIETMKKQKFIIIGDSYTRGSTGNGLITPWTDYFKSYMGLSDSDCVASGVSGSGFCAGQTFINQLENIEITNPEQVKYIIVVGGANDRNSSLADLQLAIDAFCDKAKDLYPNALVYCGMLGWSMSNNTYPALLATVLKAYQAGTRSNYRYITNSEFILHRRGILADDGIHPNETGQLWIARHIITGLNASCDVSYTEVPDVEITSFQTISTGHSIIHNNICNFSLPRTSIAFNENQIIGTTGGAEFILGTIKSGCAFTGNNLRNSVSTYVLLKDVNGKWHLCNTVIAIRGNQLVMKPVDLNVDTNVVNTSYEVTNMIIPDFNIIHASMGTC